MGYAEWFSHYVNCFCLYWHASFYFNENDEDYRKQKIRKVFWYFYGIIFILSGLINLLEKEALNFIFLIQIILGTLIIILNFLGKIETKPN